MGISGLLPFVKKASREVNVSIFSGQTAAVDVYCWLHKGAFSCAEKLVKGEPTDGYVHYILKMVTMLLRAGVTPILVFDGQNLPSKKQTELRRRENREKNRKKAKEFLREGKIREARECFQRSIDITPQMAREVVLACRAKGVDCLVAPYEADAQLAYLCKAGIAQLVITEDSDLILFGCEKILFKMDTGGQGVLVEQSQLYLSLGMKAESFTFDKFRHTCILSGCDYLDSLPGIGLVKASKFFALSSNPNLHQALSRIPSYLRMPKVVVSEEYKNSFIKADNTFLYQLVFCPLTKRLVPLNPYPSYIDPDDLNYAGKYFSNDLAIELAKGNINVSTLERFPEPNNTPKGVPKRHHKWEVADIPESIWSSKFEVKERKKTIDEKPPIHLTKDRTVSAKMPPIYNASNKRKFETKEPVIEGPSDQDLFNMYKLDKSYTSPIVPETPEKQRTKVAREESLPRSPLSERNRETSSPPEHDAKHKSPRRNCFVVKTTSVEKPSPIVRSRFFWNATSQTQSKGTSSVSIWDRIDEPTASENTPPRKSTTSMVFSKQWPSDTVHLKSSPNVNSCFKSVKVSSVSNSQTSVDDSVPREVEFTGSKTCSDTDCKLEEFDESILSQKTNGSLTEEPSSQLSDFEELLSQKSTNLSQLTVYSIDFESFELSQISVKSASPLDMLSDVKEVNTSVASFKKQTPMRRIGLSKKKKQPVATAGQLSLKEAFAKFRYTK